MTGAGVLSSSAADDLAAAPTGTASAQMGGISLAFSPGFAWTLPLALALVVAWGGPRRPCGRASKGE